MIKETEQFLQSLKKQNVLKAHKRERRIYLLKKYAKIGLYVLLGISIFGVLFFPTFTASLIGNWVVNFIGTIVTIISNGF